MNFIIPMAGKGSRFVNAGYSVPKMLIDAKGKTLLQWSVDSLPLELSTKIIFIALREHLENNRIDEFILKKYPEYTSRIEFVFLDQTTRGQAETVLKAKNLLDLTKGSLIFNIDTCFSSSTLKKNLMMDNDGVLGSFIAHDPRYSFAKVNADGTVVQVAEKNPISEYALTGMYSFNNTVDFITVAEEAIQNNETVNNEFYIAPLYNKLISKGSRFVIDMVDDYSILGTPEELTNFLNK